MATNYPASLDVLTDPIATDALNSVTVPHATQHANANDAIVAVETELGVLPKGIFGSVVARLNSLAPLVAPSLTGTATVTASGAANIPLIVKGAAAQSADLQEWQDSTGAVVAALNINSFSVGVGHNIGSDFFTSRSNGSGTYLALDGASASAVQRTAGSPAFIVKGAAAQTADLLQTQDSTGAVKYAVGANGTIASGTTAGAPTLASAATIAPVTPIAFVSGVTTINTITAPAPISTNGGVIRLIPTGIFLTGVSGNIALASTSVVNKALIMTYDPITTKWYPSY